MNLRATFILISFLMPCLSFAAPPPDEIRYSFVSIGLTGGEIDAGLTQDVDFSQASVTGSWGVHPNIALFGGIAGGEIQTSDLGPFTDIDTAAVSLGLVPHFPLGSKVDILIPVAYEWVELDDGFTTIDDSGYSIGIGIRALVSPSWELAVGITHVDIGDDDDQTVGGSVRWHIVKLFSLSLGARASGDVSAVTLGGRFTF
jgi:hypothetical protein